MTCSNRDFTAEAPNRIWVTDFTYVPHWAGFVYVAFIVDVFAQRIVAWHAATTKPTDLVMTPLRMALWQRDRDGNRPPAPEGLIHHTDAGSQGGFKWSSQHLDDGGVWWRRGEARVVPDRALRRPMRSPGRPRVRRAVQRRFWARSPRV